MSAKPIIVVGAGGQARETRWLVDCINRVTPTYDFLGYVVTDTSALKATDSQESVLGDYGWLEANRGTVECVAIGIGTPASRRSVGEEISQLFPGLDMPALVHPSAIFDQSTATLGTGVLICAGVVGTVNLVLADYCLLNFGTTFGHEVRVGKATVINPGAAIGGGVVLGDEVLIGSGAQVLQYRSVGDGATVGSGAVVTRDIHRGETVVGIPARPIANTPVGPA